MDKKVAAKLRDKIQIQKAFVFTCGAFAFGQDVRGVCQVCGRIDLTTWKEVDNTTACFECVARASDDLYDLSAAVGEVGE